MQRNQNTHIIVIGRTGDGKSSICNLIARTLQYPNSSPFVEGNLADSETSNTSSITQGRYTIVDTPGLMDTSGIGQDAINIRNIVDRSKQLIYFNGIVLLFNWKAKRFDAGMQDALRLNIDSFGRGALNHLGIMYTRCPELDDEEKQEMLQHSQSVMKQINNRCQGNLRNIPFWFVDCHPEEFLKRRVPQEVVNEYKANSEQQIKDMLRWADSKPQYLTKDSVYGEYEQVQKRKLAEQQAAKEEKLRMEETKEKIAAMGRETQERGRREKEEKGRMAAEAQALEAKGNLEHEEKLRMQAEANAQEEKAKREMETQRRQELEAKGPQVIHVHHHEKRGPCVIM